MERITPPSAKREISVSNRGQKGMGGGGGLTVQKRLHIGLILAHVWKNERSSHNEHGIMGCPILNILGEGVAGGGAAFYIWETQATMRGHKLLCSQHFI